jgi:hypothetical protein
MKLITKKNLKKMIFSIALVGTLPLGAMQSDEDMDDFDPCCGLVGYVATGVDRVNSYKEKCVATVQDFTQKCKEHMPKIGMPTCNCCNGIVPAGRCVVNTCCNSENGLNAAAVSAAIASTMYQSANKEQYDFNTNTSIDNAVLVTAGTALCVDCYLLCQRCALKNRKAARIHSVSPAVEMSPSSKTAGDSSEERKSESNGERKKRYQRNVNRAIRKVIEKPEYCALPSMLCSGLLCATCSANTTAAVATTGAMACGTSILYYGGQLAGSAVNRAVCMGIEIYKQEKEKQVAQSATDTTKTSDASSK